jgi:hypothetical protein
MGVRNSFHRLHPVAAASLQLLEHLDLALWDLVTERGDRPDRVLQV